MARLAYMIEIDDAKRYRKSLYAVRKRLITAFEQSDDMSFRKWINAHGPILDELIEELGGRIK
jgi:hypothetical protein